MFHRIRSAWLGTSIGALVSLLSGWVYLVVLREPGSAFYPFAALAFLGGPLVGGVVGMLNTQKHRIKAFFASASVIFGMVFLLFVVAYLVLPQVDRRSVQLPAFCDGFDGSFNPPSYLAYTLPNAGTGILVTSDAQSAVVAMIDYQNPPFPSSVFLVNKSDNRIIESMRFNNDVISAALDQDTLYIYNDKLGYVINARTGELENNVLLMDNYGGLSESDRPILMGASSGHWYMETAAVISSWNVNGTVKSRPHLTLNGIARACFVSGDTQNVVQLDTR